MTLREVVWVSHPYGQDPANLARAKRWVAYLERNHPEWSIHAPWIEWAEAGRFANDEQAALEACRLEVTRCRRLISVGTREPSPGMRSEWMQALRLGMGVMIYSTEAEPPANGDDPESRARRLYDAFEAGDFHKFAKKVSWDELCVEWKEGFLRVEAAARDMCLAMPGGRGDQVGPTARSAQAFLSRVSELLAEKNRAYGDSVANPVRIFSASAADEGVRVRIDDKLSRIARGQAAGEDVLTDLCGYVALLAAMEEEKRAKGQGGAR